MTHIPTRAEWQDQDEMFRIIAENISDTVVVVDHRAVVRYVSPNIEAMTGYTIEQYEGMDAFDVIHPEDRDHVRLCFQQVVESKVSEQVEYRIEHVQGHTVYAETRVKPVVGSEGTVKYVVAIVRDVTERKKSELALEESGQRYKSLFDNNLDGVFSIDLSGNIVSGNAAFEQITGIKPNQLPEHCFMGLLFDEDQFTVLPVFYEVMQNKEPRDIECRISRMGQGERIVHMTLVPILVFNELKGVHGIVKDITERKKEERELIRSEERSKFLQQSLNRFSGDLASVMKVSELENRLIDKVKEVLRVEEVSIEEIQGGSSLLSRDECEINIKIGEKGHHLVYLRIEIRRSLDPIEEEWLETAVRYVTLLYDNLQLLEDLMSRLEHIAAHEETPKWMMRLLFKLSEKERASLSSDLHDSVLQDLIIWYRKLESLRSRADFTQDSQHQLKQIEEGLLDAIHQIRITCNELRPPFLLKMGLVESLRGLFSYARMFANYEIEFTAEQVDVDLDEEQILGLYRVVQELLNNASKHAQASKVAMSLAVAEEVCWFAYCDDGIGMDLTAYADSFQHMGIAGIEKRVLSLEGEIEMRSAPQQGFQVKIRMPLKNRQTGGRYGNFIGG